MELAKVYQEEHERSAAGKAINAQSFLDILENENLSQVERLNQAASLANHYPAESSSRPLIGALNASALIKCVMLLENVSMYLLTEYVSSKLQKNTGRWGIWDRFRLVAEIRQVDYDFGKVLVSRAREVTLLRNSYVHRKEHKVKKIEESDFRNGADMLAAQLRKDQEYRTNQLGFPPCGKMFRYEHVKKSLLTVTEFLADYIPTVCEDAEAARFVICGKQKLPGEDWKPLLYDRYRVLYGELKVKYGVDLPFLYPES